MDRYLREGREMRLDDAIRIALGEDKLPTSREVARGKPAGTATAYSEGLTPREEEVLRLIAAGKTDARIAEDLTLSSRTVQAHVRSIYTKLGITSRAQATRYALDHGLA